MKKCTIFEKIITLASAMKIWPWSHPRSVYNLQNVLKCRKTETSPFQIHRFFLGEQQSFLKICRRHLAFMKRTLFLFWVGFDWPFLVLLSCFTFSLADVLSLDLGFLHLFLPKISSIFASAKLDWLNLNILRQLLRWYSFWKRYNNY